MEKTDKLPIPTGADQPHNCPACGVSLLGEPIAEELYEMYLGRYYKREIGHYNWDADRTEYYSCPDCEAKFFSDGKMFNGDI